MIVPIKGGIMPIKGGTHTSEARRKIKIARANQIPPTLGFHHSEETKIKMSKAQIGEKGNAWKGGISRLNELIRKNYKYRQWRCDVYTRDDFTCQDCGAKDKKLHTHHIKPLILITEYYNITTLKEALECEEIYNINNGITLCEGCHKERHNGE